MKKIIIVFCLSFLLLMTTNINALATEINSKYEYDTDAVVAGGGTYQVTNRTNHEQLFYGITYTRDIALSQSLNQIGGNQTFDPQVVNVLEMPINTNAKVVNWTYSSASSWTKQTVSILAKDFEANNPGWIVLAGINGDFFDIKGKGALPYQTNGAAVSNGDVLRAVSSSQVGFTNDGTSTSLIGNENLTYTKHHILAVYDDNDDIIKEFEIDNFNQLPENDEISVYFSYYAFRTEGEGDDAVKVNYTEYNTVPATNSYLVDFPIRSYANSKDQMFGKGVISDVNVEQKLLIGDFAVVTTNSEVQSLLKKGVKIRVQQNVTGIYANCDNITGGGITLVDNGEANPNISDLTDYRHPRTIIGQQNDGTIVFLTVDGRQESNGMYGMSYEEMSAMMLYYNCTKAYNLDGGGSTTMVIRNAQGDFDVVNSPSDGGVERCDSNALLIVAPEMSLNVTSVTDQDFNFTYNNKAKDISISNFSVTLTNNSGFNETRMVQEQPSSSTELINSESYQWTNLVANTDYNVSYHYLLNYQGKSTEITSTGLMIHTGFARPTVTDYYYELLGDNYILHFKLDDPNNTILSSMIKYDKRVEIITVDQEIIYIAAANVVEPKFELSLVYNVHSSHGDNLSASYQIKAYEEEEPIDEIKPGKKCAKKSAEIIFVSISLSSLLGILLRKKNN